MCVTHIYDVSMHAILNLGSVKSLACRERDWINRSVRAMPRVGQWAGQAAAEVSEPWLVRYHPPLMLHASSGGCHARQTARAFLLYSHIINRRLFLTMATRIAVVLLLALAVCGVFAGRMPPHATSGESLLSLSSQEALHNACACAKQELSYQA